MKNIIAFLIAVLLVGFNWGNEETPNNTKLLFPPNIPDSIRIDGLIKTAYVCPDCGEWGCIYEQIDEAYEDGRDLPTIEAAITAVCKERGIADSTTIDLLKANYDL